MTATDQRPPARPDEFGVDTAWSGRGAWDDPRGRGGDRPGRGQSPHLGRWRAWLAFRGVLALVVGGLILARPDLTIEAFALIVGIFFCLVGIARIVIGAADTQFPTGIRVLNVIFGVLLTALGAVSIRYPGFGLLATVLIIGFAWLMEGGATLAVLPPRHRGRGWAVAFAVVSLAAGALVIIWPVESVLPLIVVVGAFLAVGGVFDVAAAIAARPGRRPNAVE
ncbi:MAG: DUF308 domain-containing protein [Bifidobacteriaceae bacterium]|jgi:uncharacterized membrane protein HdeD (DUF308 family)|nr:DUF308 domain-containing protein [Bifidobacteriaceae bacterium]